MSTLVQVKCQSKKEIANYDPKNPVHTEIEFAIPYDTKSVFYQLSGGTTMVLRTINKDAADQFVIGGNYDITISPTVAEEVAP